MEPTADVRSGEVVWLDLASTDIAAAAGFYEGLFGWRFAEPDSGGYRVAALDGLPVAGLVASSPDEPASAWMPYLDAVDIARTFGTAVEHGADGLAAPDRLADHGVFAVVADPSGAAVGLLQPDSFAGLGELGRAGAPVWFEVHATDAAAAGAFYAGVFGLTRVPHADPALGYETLSDSAGDTVFGVLDVAEGRDAAAPSTWFVYFGTLDLEADVARAVELGASLRFGPAACLHGRVAVLVDPAGAVFGLFEIAG